MFTGLVQQLGAVLESQAEGPGRLLVLSWPGPGRAQSEDPLSVGESIAVNGCCLTAVSVEPARFTVELGPETLERTNLGTLEPGDRVNLERALRPVDRLGGHFVQGHIDTTAELIERTSDGEWAFLRFRTDREWMELLVEKGSIALDGVSLTLVDVGLDQFSVMLIPHTLAVTTLGRLQLGDRVNMETDLLAKHLRRLVRFDQQSSSDR